MRRLYLTIICMTLLFLRPLPVHADYLSDYEAPAHYTIQMDAGADPQTDGPVSIEANTSKNRYAAYLNVVENCIEQYGDTDSLEGPSYGMEHFTGLSFAKLIDFNDDGTEELFLVFYVRTNDVSESYENYVYIYNVWGYDGEQAVLLQDGNYLYGFNGGYQAVFFVENPFGTFFLHGCADSFQYDYYYGYEGDNFCLAKTLKQDEQYDESAKRMNQVYTVDGKSVSQNFYKEESALWGTTYDPSEKYVLTYSSEAERDKTYDMTYDTIVFLQQVQSGQDLLQRARRRFRRFHRFLQLHHPYRFHRSLPQHQLRRPLRPRQHRLQNPPQKHHPLQAHRYHLRSPP